MNILRALVNNPFKEKFYNENKYKKIINVLSTFFIFYKTGIKTFLKLIVNQ